MYMMLPILYTASVLLYSLMEAASFEPLSSESDIELDIDGNDITSTIAVRISLVEC